jgi:hypothetical protein
MNTKKPPQRDPIGAFQRRATAARRIGADKQCACGETRPEALISGSDPTICAKCDREKKGRTVMDNHHVEGKANSSETIPTPVNDHRAELNTAQQDWPKGTLQNPDGCPLLRTAACVRGVIDYLHYLIDKFLHWIPEMLEMLSAFLKEKLGSKWWVGSPLQQFAPGR